MNKFFYERRYILKKIKYGFTLIELMAVIIILGVIALIAIPVVGNIVESARRKTFEESVLGAFKAAIYKTGMDEINGVPLESEIDVQALPLSNNVLQGKFTLDDENELVAYYIKDDRYCAYGEMTNLNIEQDCALLDQTIPIINETKVVLTSTTNSITVIINDDVATDLESGITKYKFNLYKDDKIVETKELDNIGNYIFKNLKNDTEYTLELIVINGNNLNNVVRKTIKTKLINSPTYVVEPSGWSISKTVTINYPVGFINEYSIDSGENWIKYNDPFVLTENANIITRVSDGYNYIIGSSEIISKIDSVKPSVSILGTTSSGAWTNQKITLSANITPSTTISGYTYEWYKDDVKISDASKDTYIVDTNTLINSNYKVKVITGAGNNDLSSGYNVSIDKIKPIISINKNGGDYEITSSISSTIGTTDEESGINELFFAWSESNTVTPSSFTKINNNSSVQTTATGPSKYLWVKANDKAGNTNTINSNSFNTFYKIKYDANGGTANINDQNKKYNVDLKLSTVIPTRNNYEFMGWATSSTGSVEYASGQNYTKNESKTLYAIWKILLTEETVTLSFPSDRTQNRTLTKVLEGYNSIVSVTIDNGNVSYTMSGSTISVSASNGKATLKQSCTNQYVCEDYTSCATTCWSCSESTTGTCCGCYGCWPNGTCCCTPQHSCAWKDVCSNYNYYEYLVTIKYMKGS